VEGISIAEILTNEDNTIKTCIKCIQRYNEELGYDKDEDDSLKELKDITNIPIVKILIKRGRKKRFWCL
jgi:hypothetical protein